ncbi:MAG: hypothetical protein H3C47_01785 [Candidatus Cloacimonetes bacterium]|nr:hypothetical protein [Candidatus Cloacimonadota bacterium]
MTNQNRYFRRGVVIFVAFSLIGIIGVFAAIYLYSSSQSKSMSRRIFWGESAFFLAESILDETFHILKVRSRDPRETKIGGGAWFETTLESQKGKKLLMDVRAEEYTLLKEKAEFIQQMGVSPKDIEILIRTIPFEKASNSRLASGEIHGVMEVVVTMRVPLGIGAKQESGITRQVVGRREFRRVKVLGNDVSQEYMLMVKNPPPTHSGSNSDFTRLNLVNPLPNSHSSVFGRVWLGDKDSPHVLQPAQTSGLEALWLSKSGVYGERNPAGFYENEFRDARFFEDNQAENKDRLEFVLDNLLQDPNLSRVMQETYPGQNFVFANLNEEQKQTAREILRQWLISNFRSYPNNVLSMRSYPAGIAYPSLSISIDSPLGNPVAIEGKAVRLFGFLGENLYNGKMLGGEEASETESKFSFYDIRLAAELYTHKEKAWLPVFYGVEGKSNNVELANKHVGFTVAENFAYIYGISDRGAFLDYLASHALKTTDGKIYIKLDGVSVVYDHLVFRGEYVYDGCGVLLAVGGVTFESGSSLKRVQPESASCMAIVARNLPVKSSRSPALSVQTVEPIEAHISVLGFDAKTSQNKWIASSPVNIKGGVATDDLDLNQIPIGSTIVYDEVFSRQYAALSVGVPIQFYKIHNLQKEKKD